MERPRIPTPASHYPPAPPERALASRWQPVVGTAMPVFTVEVVEVVVYRGEVEAESEEQAREAAVQDLIAHSGAGLMTFAEVADRTATILDE